MKKIKVGIEEFLIRHMVFVAFVTASLMLTIWIMNEYSFFLSESKTLREDYLRDEKAKLRSEVNNVVDYINYMKSQTNSRLESELKGRIYEAVAIAEHIYREYESTRPPDEIEKMFKDAVRPIRFLNGRGYYFAFTMDGIETLFADRPEMEGMNMLPVQGAKGEYVVRDMIGIVQKQQEGFYQYTWTKPGQEGKKFLKMAFVKHIPCFDWAIGTGEYLDDFTGQVQDLVLERIVGLKFRDEGYFFGSMEGGFPLFTNGKITRGNRNIWDLTDLNGVKIVQEQQKASQNPEGGFVEYVWPKPDSHDPVPKISYIRTIPEWGWIIGAGIYLDTIETLIVKNEAALKEKLINKLIASVGVFIGLIVMIWFWARRVAGQTRKNIRTFESVLEKAAVGYITIPAEDMQFHEFSRIADSVNQMIESRKQSEEALRESERRYRELFESSRDGYVVVDINGQFVDCNSAYCDLVGYSLSELQRKTDFYEITPIQWREWEREEIWERRLLKEGYSGIYEKEYIRKDGSLIPVELQTYAISSDQGEIRYLWGIVRDITERKRAGKEREKLQAQLTQAQKMESVGRLAGGVAHDFNNMLGVILGYAELAMDKPALSDSIQHYLQEIYKAAERSREVTRQLLSFARKQTISPRVLDLNVTVEGMLNMLRRLIGEDISLIWSPAGKLRPVKMDPSQIDQILANLCVNARDAIADVGKITIKTRNVSLDRDYCVAHEGAVPGDYVLLAVSDDGRGMTPEILANLFEPFFTTKGVGKGTGLGLATVYGIVKQNNGFIHVDSEPEKGTTFRIYLPRHDQPMEQESMKEPAAVDARGNETILLVEDEPAILSMATNMLERLGYTVLTADTPGKAIQMADEQNGDIHLLMTDVVMPEMNGKDLAGKLLSMVPDLKCLFMSGYTADVIAHHGVLDGDVHYIQKPFILRDLAAAVRKALEEA
ncbi:MAG: PAS domain S-box protein [Desulfobacteraceae bacterium]|nr:MAG: PAS domain S-box protein [Desulfobacteraceae bacterium]